MTRTRKQKPKPREPVRWFAGEMETKLGENDHKGGWRDCDFDYLEKRLREELAELGTVLMHYQIAALSPNETTRTRYLGEKAKREAADVANFAMMIADRLRGELLDLGRRPSGRKRSVNKASRVCVHCGLPDGKGPRELRPYGPGGTDVCAECARHSTPERRSETEKQFASKLDAAGDAAVLTSRGPQRLGSRVRGKG